MRFITRVDANTTLVLMTDEELNAAVTSLDRMVAAVSDLRCLLAGHEAATALPQAVSAKAVAQGGTGRPKTVTCACGTVVKVGSFGLVPKRCKACAEQHRLGKGKASKRRARRNGKADAPVPGAAVGAPCTVCGGDVDRTGCGGYKRTVCAACKAKGATAAAVIVDRVDRIRKAFARVDAISPTAADEAQHQRSAEG